MRVHFIGNICNNHYVIAKALRAGGVDAHLFYPANGDIQVQPTSNDPELAGKNPDWVCAWTDGDLGSAPQRRLPERFARQLFDCDLLHVHDDVGLLWAMWSGKPYVWHPYGTDFFVYPFYAAQQPRNIALPDWFLYPLDQRRAIAGASAVITEWWFDVWAPGYRMLQRFGMWDRIVHIPHIAIEPEKFSPPTPAQKNAARAHLAPGLADDALLLFHPTRQMITSASNAYFGNDRLYRALGRLKQQGRKLQLVIVEKKNSDEDVARRIIVESGIAEDVRWVPMMPRHELIEWYRAADLTVAELAGGSTGAVAFEAMACGAPVLGQFLHASTDPTFWRGPIEPPCLNPQNESEIFDLLDHACARPEALPELGARSRAWICENMSATAIAGRCRDLYEEVLSRKRHPWPAIPEGVDTASDAELRAALAALPSYLDMPDAIPTPADPSHRALYTLARHYAREAVAIEERWREDRLNTERNLKSPKFLLHHLFRRIAGRP